MKENRWLRDHWLILLTGVVVSVAALILTAAGNPKNMGFCIACFERDIAGALGLHSAAKVQYIRPEIIGIVLGALLSAVAAFHTTAAAMSAERLCRQEGLEGRLIPVPRSVTSDCGIAWSAPAELRDTLERRFREAGLEVAGIFLLSV